MRNVWASLSIYVRCSLIIDKRLLLMSTIESRKVPRICLLFWRVDMLSMCSERIISAALSLELF